MVIGGLFSLPVALNHRQLFVCAWLWQSNPFLFINEPSTAQFVFTIHSQRHTWTLATKSQPLATSAKQPHHPPHPFCHKTADAATTATATASPTTDGERGFLFTQRQWQWHSRLRGQLFLLPATDSCTTFCYVHEAFRGSVTLDFVEKSCSSLEKALLFMGVFR